MRKECLKLYKKKGCREVRRTGFMIKSLSMEKVTFVYFPDQMSFIIKITT